MWYIIFKLMGRKLKSLVMSVLLSLTFLNVSDTFGGDRCLYDHNGNTHYDEDEDYTDKLLPDYKCKKVDPNLCYFPELDKTLAPQYFDEPPSMLLDMEFSSKYGGCSLYIGYPQNKIWADYSDKRGKIENFIAACEREGYFSTKIDIIYVAYDKGNLIEVTRQLEPNKNIHYNDGYSLEEKIRNFKDAVKNDVNNVIYGRDVYTLRVEKAVIIDNKCRPPKFELKDKPISVFTKLPLELKLNADDRIVYDDKETKKIEVNADQDEFYFGDDTSFSIPG